MRHNFVGRRQLTIRKRLISSAAALLLLSFQAHADDAPLLDLPIEELLGLKVSGASKFQQAVANAPSSVTIVTERDIKLYGWRTLADVLASMRGLYVTNDLSYSFVGGRGYARPSDYNTRFLLLVDGMKLNDSIYDQASIGMEFPVDLELIERIEYIPGSSSAVYGSNAFFGVINIVTKATDQFVDRPYGSISLGSKGERKVTAAYATQSEKGSNFMVSATTYRRDGGDVYFKEFDTPANNFGVARRLDYEQAQSALIKGSLGPFALTITHSDRTKGIPTASYEQTFNDRRSKTQDIQTNAALSYQSETEISTLLTRIAWGQQSFSGVYTYDGYVNLDGSQSSWVSGEINYLMTGWRNHKILVGAELQRDYQRIQHSTDVAEDGTTSPLLYTNNPATKLAAFVQDEIFLSKSFLLNIGARFDHHSQSSSALSPRVALIYQPSARTTLKAIDGKAFRSPNAYEMFYEVDAIGGQRANSRLRPERIHSQELVLEQQLDSSSKVTLSTFKNKATNLITQTDDGTGRPMFQNIDEAKTKGVEVEYERTWSSRATIRASQVWQRANDSNSGERLVNSPLSSSKVNFQVPIPRTTFFSGVEVRYVGERKGLAGDLNSYVVTNVTFHSSKFIKDCELSISVYNLFDKRYGDPGGLEHRQNSLPQEGRAFRVKLSRAF